MEVCIGSSSLSLAMREGGERKVVIHPEALEDMREEFPSIPKDSKLLFHVKLLKTF